MNESFEDRHKVMVRQFSINWTAFDAMYPEHPAFEHGSKAEIGEWLAFIRQEESQPASNVLLGQKGDDTA